MSENERDQLSQRFDSDAEMEHAVSEAVRKTLAEHKRQNHKIAVWRGGKVVILSPEEIKGDGNAQ